MQVGLRQDTDIHYNSCGGSFGRLFIQRWTVSDPGGRIVRRNKQLMIIKMHFPGATTTAAAIVGVWPNNRVDRAIVIGASAAVGPI